MDRLDEQIAENKQFSVEVQALRLDFQAKKPPPDIVSKVSRTGRYLNFYNHVKNLSFGDSYTGVQSNHKTHVAPRFEIDVNKEVELLANKFRLLSTKGDQEAHIEKSPLEETHE